MRRLMALRLVCLVQALTCLSAGADECPANQPQIAPDAGAQADVETRLGSGRFRFCTDQEYRLWQVDKDRLCSRVAEIGADCTALAAACSRPAWDEKAPDAESPSWLWQLSSLLGSVGGEIYRGLFWLALAGGALYLLLKLIRVLKVSAGAEGQEKVAPVRTGPEEIDPESQPAGLLLEQAAQYLEAGDARRALHFAYAALLAGLAGAGKVRIHRALTTGDYRRSLRRSAGDQGAGGLLWDLDLARFRQAIDPDGARLLTLRVRELLSRLVAVLLVFSSAGLLGCSDRAQAEAPYEPTAPRGYALFEELAAARAKTFTRRLRRVTELPANTTAVVLLAPHLRQLEWDTLESYVEAGGHLIVAGRTEGLDRAFGLKTEPATCTGPIQVLGLRTITPDTSETSLDALTPQTADAILATCGSMAFARVHLYGDGQVTLVGDESLFDNTSLGLAENASFVLSLIDSAPGHMEFIGPWTGTGAVHPLESIARSSVGPWLLHLLALLALLAWSRGRRFGTPRAPSTSKRRSLVEHARALGGHYRRQGDVGAGLARYAAWAVALLSRRSGSSSRDLRALSLALVAKRGKQATGDVTAAELHQMLLRARAGAELGGDKPKLMRAYRILRSMVEEVGGPK